MELSGLLMDGGGSGVPRGKLFLILGGGGDLMNGETCLRKRDTERDPRNMYHALWSIFPVCQMMPNPLKIPEILEDVPQIPTSHRAQLRKSKVDNCHQVAPNCNQPLDHSILV